MNMISSIALGPATSSCSLSSSELPLSVLHLVFHLSPYVTKLVKKKMRKREIE